GYTLHASESTTVVDVDERDALGGATHFTDLGNPGTNQHTAVGDQHDLVGGPHQHSTHHLAVAVAGLNGDHALRTATVAGVLGDGSTFAITVVGSGEHALVFAIGHQQRYHAL